jgi:ABC-type transporter Mla subunit MlaD
VCSSDLDELAASLQTTKARVEVLETETIPLDETIYEFEALVAQQSALEGIRHAHAQMLHELRYAAGQATFASQQVSARRDHVQADLAKARDALSAIASEAASVERASQEARDQHQLVRTRRDALGAAKRALVALEDELKKSISGGDPRVEHTRLTREAAARQKDIADVQSTRDDLGRAEQRLVDLEAELAKAAEGLEVGQSKTRVAQVAALDRDLRDSIGAIEKAVLTMQAMRRQAMPPGTSASLGKLIDKAVKRLSEARLMYLASDATKVRNAAREMEEQSRILAEMADKLDGIRN